MKKKFKLVTQSGCEKKTVVHSLRRVSMSTKAELQRLIPSLGRTTILLHSDGI